MQSTYRKHHSTDTILLRVINDILRTIDRPPRCRISTPWFSSGLWHYWPYDSSSRKNRVLLCFLKTDTELVHVLPWKPTAINNYWRWSVHSSRSVLWCPTTVYAWTATLHTPCFCTRDSTVYSYRSCKSGSFPDCLPNLYGLCNAIDHAKYAKKWCWKDRGYCSHPDLPRRLTLRSSFLTVPSLI